MPKFNLFVLTTCLIVFSSSSVYAKKPEGEQSGGKDGICAPLKAKGVTPSLYGICVAYHSSGGTNQELLAKYNARKSPSDPIMPGTEPELDLLECECWNHLAFEEIGVNRENLPDSAFLLDPDPVNPVFDYLTYQDVGTGFYETLYVAGDTCGYSYFDPAAPENPEPVEIAGLTETEEGICRSEIIDFVDCHFLGTNCPDSP